MNEPEVSLVTRRFVRIEVTEAEARMVADALTAAADALYADNAPMRVHSVRQNLADAIRGALNA